MKSNIQRFPLLFTKMVAQTFPRKNPLSMTLPVKNRTPKSQTNRLDKNPTQTRKKTLQLELAGIKQKILANLCPFHMFLFITLKTSFFPRSPPPPPKKNEHRKMSSQDIAGGVAPRQRWSEFHRCDKGDGSCDGREVVEKTSHPEPYHHS